MASPLVLGLFAIAVYRSLATAILIQNLPQESPKRIELGVNAISAALGGFKESFREEPLEHPPKLSKGIPLEILVIFFKYLLLSASFP